MRIAIIGLLHESNTFVATTTTRRDFQDCQLDIGQDVLRRWRGAHHEIGGFLEGAGRFGFEPVPIFATVAVPSGPLCTETFEGFWHDISSGLRGAGDVDGILLALHGATVAAGTPDADGEVVTRLRAQVGPRLPVVMTLDLHANISPRMIDGVTATILYRTTPHVDQRDRGLEAARLIAGTVRGEIRPVQALRKPPMVANVAQDTSREPASALRRKLEEEVELPSMLAAGIGYGFPRADVQEMGMSVVVVADADQSAANGSADRLAQAAWQMRYRFQANVPAPDEAIRQAAEWDGQPVVVSDLGDNVGGGAPGDSTVLLEQIVQQDVPDALIVLHDPQAAQTCAAAGAGIQVDLAVGAKASGGPGRPLVVRGRVRTISDGLFYEPQPRHGGRSDNNQGLTAVVETPGRHTIVLTSLRMAPMSLQQILSLGIDPRRKKIIVVKGAIAPRAAYAPVASHFILADTPGPTSADLNSFEYRHRRRPMFPWERDARYEP
jgi:microcystin degradation protein MlrC